MPPSVFMLNDSKAPSVQAILGLGLTLMGRMKEG